MISVSVGEENNVGKGNVLVTRISSFSHNVSKLENPVFLGHVTLYHTIPTFNDPEKETF